MNWSILGDSFKWNHTILVLLFVDISLRMFSRSIHIAADIRFHSILRLNSILLHVYTPFCLSIRLSMDTRVVSTFWLLWKMWLWTWVSKYLFMSLLSILLHLRQEVQLPHEIVVLCLMFWETTRLFSTALAPFYTLASNGQEFQFLHILINISDSTTSSFNHPLSRCKVVSRCGIDLHFPNA